ncbi:MAG: hypothetical protein HYV03_00945 [Deltaproteobacteria bacterium]|nr:hypothetical protein [Deltaproteobacteria bacterium]
MKEFSVRLCGSGSGCGCPAVAYNGKEAAIGEDNNIVRLTTAEWNLLVAKIKAGELSEIA